MPKSSEQDQKRRQARSDSEDESEILEESPCGRWHKRREEVQQRDVPGIDMAYLAMDVEEGFEVVWNEVRFSDTKNLKAREEGLRQVFENLIQLDHPNIVKFHKYWIDIRDDKPRVIFITEYMSCGSLKEFLKRTKRNVKKSPLHAWKRWCTQILSALSYLHSCSPPIVHGNLSCDSIFIQHNGLIKIGCVAPHAIHQHVKMSTDPARSIQFLAPELAKSLSPAVDIYSFGMCALEMGALEICGNGDSGAVFTEEQVLRTLESLEGTAQKDLIRLCLREDPRERPSARELLFHPALFEVPSLKLLSAHVVVKHPESVTSKTVDLHYGPGSVIAEIQFRKTGTLALSMKDVAAAEKLDKFVEDVKFGLYPLPFFELQHPTAPSSRACTPDSVTLAPSESPEVYDGERRRVLNSLCHVKETENGHGFHMLLLLRMDDQVNRQLSCSLGPSDSSAQLALELVQYGFINAVDQENIAGVIENAKRRCSVKKNAVTSANGTG